MAAAVPVTTASALYGEPRYWNTPNFQCENLIGNAGLFDSAAGVGGNRNECATGAVNLSVNSPVAIAFQLAGDCDHVYLGHTLSFYPNDPLNASAFDDHVLVLLGNDLTTALPLALNVNAFTKAGPLAGYNRAYITGANGHAHAAAPVYRFAHTAVGTADTDEIRVRKALLIPANLSPDFLQAAPNGRLTLLGFYNLLVPEIDSADAGRVQRAGYMFNWFRAACMGTAADADASPIEVTPAASLLPLENHALQAYSTRVREQQLHRLGVGGPGLTTAAFNAGVQRISQTLTDQHDATLAFERTRDDKTFTARCGEPIANVMHRLTGADRDENLPQIHNTLAKASKTTAYAILVNNVQGHARTSPVPLTDGCLPLVSTKVFEEVFRTFQPSDTGLEFAKGLSPFSMVCQGHKEAATVTSKAARFEMASRGTSLNLQDAETLIATDARFPTTPQQCAEKVYAFSVLLDVFHGENHPVARNMRLVSGIVGPALHTVHLNAGAPAVGLDLCLRVLYELQQEYFMWVNQTAHQTNPVLRPVAPTFMRIVQLVQSHRASSLAHLPNSWYTMLNVQNPSTPAAKADPRDMRAKAGATPDVNHGGDASLQKRFSDSPHNAISAMLQGKTYTIPKHNNKEICLSWALKGSCHTNCRRKDSHVRYPESVTKKIHQLLTDCEVAEA